MFNLHNNSSESLFTSAGFQSDISATSDHLNGSMVGAVPLKVRTAVLDLRCDCARGTAVLVRCGRHSRRITRTGTHTRELTERG